MSLLRIFPSYRAMQARLDAAENDLETADADNKTLRAVLKTYTAEVTRLEAELTEARKNDGRDKATGRYSKQPAKPSTTKRTAKPR